MGIWTLVAGYVLKGSLGDNPLTPSLAARRNLLVMTPQGWAFFTRNPREPVDRVYKREREGWSAVGYTHSSPQNLFGLRRMPRASGSELAYMLERMSNGDWVDCAASLNECLGQHPGKMVLVENRAVKPFFCGKFLIERRRPIPWAWSGMSNRIHMPAQLLIINANCIHAN